MIGRPSCRLWLNTAKAQPGQIKLTDKNIDRPDRIILGQLTARETTCSDCGHRQRQSASSNPPVKSQENHIIERRFHTVWTQLGHFFE
jgi:hypothetical protein